MTYLSINQVAARLGVHRKTVRGWISTGRLPGYRFGPRLIRVHESAVDQLRRPIPAYRRPE